MHPVAVVQMVSGENPDTNLEGAANLVARAAQNGARLVVLPENFALMHPDETHKVRLAEADGEGPLQAFLADTARRNQVYLVGGTIPLRASQPGKVRAACLVHDPQGYRIARYDKMHLFDVTLVSEIERETYRESDTIEAGDRWVSADTQIGTLGLAVCYDLRFPALFSRLALEGMDVLVLPAAFTATTGRAHWEILLRARAIESQCYVLASAQGGRHPGGRQTWGHSMIVDPWGEVLAVQREPGVGVVQAQLDRQRLGAVRSSLPVHQHRKPDY